MPGLTLVQEGNVVIQDAASYQGRDGRCPRCGAMYVMQLTQCKYNTETQQFEPMGHRYQCIDCGTLRPGMQPIEE